ncbi:GAF and ANTAR domain-containing protein [Cryobacterium sp. SO2]|uniref:GAF and ANTAR domain-containing protein n=1 Tax=Cryobacterium sp. SO2 TaxID=1897060 RepID=UPI00223E1F4E|nr:GAF and ANTAR domain-containing protein [Cryobacterium sp. SO2]WEO79128.1 GAF and ANTAR domain-containing protein [Cryobacterium sp. SO2]
MSDRLAFGAAVEELSMAFERRTSLCRPFLRVLPVTGAAISTLGPPFGTETVCASDADAARIDELQFDLGEGPCWDAMTTRRPVLTADLRTASPRWPLFREALGTSQVGSLFAFPLSLGSLNIGAVDLYSRTVGTLTDAQVEDATTLSGICARQVIRRTLADLPSHGVVDGEAGDGFSRREVHQATGMVLAQLGVTAADALLIINGFAFARGRSVREVAADIVARRIDFAGEWSDPSESPPESL